MTRTRIVHVLESTQIGGRFTVMGWVRTKRDAKGGFSFLEVNDGSCLRNLQVIAEQTLENYDTVVRKCHTGSAIRVTGVLAESPGKGQRVELHAEEVELLGWADPETYPLQKKRHSFEFLRTIAHLRPRTNTFGAVARVRNAVSRAIHEFFQERGFLYLHTPIISGSDCEGAGEMFRVTTLDLGRIPKKGDEVDFSRDFFGVPANLTVSGQLEAEIYALALGDVYTFGPTFRAENSNTARHLAEFWMVEPEMAFCDLGGNIDLAVAFLKFIFAYVLEHCEEDMAFFNRFIDPTVLQTLDDLVAQDFEVLSYTEGIDLLSKSKEPFEFPVAWGADLQSEHERYLCEKVFGGPVILVDYPKEIKAFYMKMNEDGKTVRAMDVLVPKIGEIIGGSQREDDHDTLLGRMRETGLDPADYWWYLDLRKYGSVPHSGFGLGFERLIQFITGLSNIRDVIPFPRTPGNLGFRTGPQER
ncbi:MAG: asparagine--tRNA ligase [Deltaproteobacteria bacterium]|nr:asparagine--tRNA ligase [Deltaproteobacteria bacterium]MBW1923837.1 asparagine--tRNA ligase [Deltaproteobacteria bacterium]MBW1948554.1 asparagine--tRNA ligase [Deltaproteobacteria bacterium]MBW2006982.1 asparagine--tRNA ligase [Deltaproteobacteria bacterium]